MVEQQTAGISLPLQPSKTMQCRELHWQRLAVPGLVGVLTGVDSANPRTKAHSHRYLVKDLAPAVPGSRRFELVKPGGEETHYVEINKWADYSRCVCTGYLQ